MRLYLIITLLIVTIASSCSDSKEKEYVEKYPNGKVKLEGILKSDNRVGEWSKYDTSGNLSEKFYYESDTLYLRETYIDGRLAMKEEMRGNLRHGKTYMYHESGKVSLITKFKEDLQTGKGSSYYPDGSIKTEFTLNENGEYTGEFKQYYPNGQVGIDAPIVGNSTYAIYGNDGEMLLKVKFKDFVPVDSIFVVKDALQKLSKSMENLP